MSTKLVCSAMCEKLASPCTRNPAWNLTGVCDLSVEKSAFSCIWHELCRSRAVCRHQLTSMLNAIIVRCHTEHTHTFEPYIVLSRMPHHGWFQLVSIFGNSKVIVYQHQQRERIMNSRYELKNIADENAKANFMIDESMTLY